MIAGFGILFGWLLIDSWGSTGKYDPNTVQLVLTPVLAGALALGLAIQLGVDPKISARERWYRRLLALINVKHLIGLGSVVYLAAAIAGVVVWGKRDNETPELVTALVLTAAGYLGAAYSTAARGRNR